MVYQWMRSGKPWIWLTGGAVSVSLLSVFGLLLLIGWKGLIYFWPMPLSVWQDKDGNQIVGQLYARTSVPLSRLTRDPRQLPDDVVEEGRVDRLSIKVGNRDLYQLDFISVLESDLLSVSYPKEWVVLEREQSGVFYGMPLAYQTNEVRYTTDVATHLQAGIENANAIRQQIDWLLNEKAKDLGWQISQLKSKKRQVELSGKLTPSYLASFDAQRVALEIQLSETETKIEALRNALNREHLVVQEMGGMQHTIALNQILDAWYPNNMTLSEQLFHWLKQVKKFVLDNPREANSEGGVFPAIFGTVFLVLMMSIIVTPLGVIAAIYLHEYAENNLLTRTIKVAVMNLAGVPSIVYGVFGLGFFVYTVGGSIDEWFYADRLPTPTFGTPGILWSALTLALLTLPVVVVSTEEGLGRIPTSVRHGSYALGATQFETLWRIVLPMASPAIMTGLILAIARAAGEVAPLMLVGVAKLAPSLPVDGYFPFVHLERKFMHLGYHIYDVGFQSPNIEAARPLVYATSFLLVMVVVGLNLTAIHIRNNLREKYRILGQD